MISSLAFASTTDLGWDPSIRFKLAVPSPTYDIDVQGLDGVLVTHTDCQVISDFGANAMQGRATRVFASATGNVIKDVWVENDREREGDILMSVRERLKGLEGVTEQGANLFLTPIGHGDVSIDEKLDQTKDFGGPPSLDPIRFLFIHQGSHLEEHKREEDPKGSVGESPVPTRDTRGPMGIYRSRFAYIRNRVHYRIAFGEQGVELWKVDNLRDHFQCLINATRGKSHVSYRNWSSGLTRFNSTGIDVSCELSAS